MTKIKTIPWKTQHHLETAEDIAAYLASIGSFCATPLGTPLDVQLKDLDRFAKKVIPAFRDNRTAAAAQ